MKRILTLLLALCLSFGLLSGCSDPVPPAIQAGLPGAYVAGHLSGMKVGYVGGLSDPELIKTESRGAKLKKFSSVEKAVAALKEGKLYAVVLPQMQADAVLSENADLAQLLGKIADLAYRIPNYYEGDNADHDILMQVDATLSQLKGTGGYQTLLDRYINGDPDAVDAIELNVGDTDRVLTVGVYTDFKPFAYKSKSGNIVGFAVEFANEVAKKWHSDIELIEYTDSDALYADSKEGKVMLALGPYVEDPEVPDAFAFSSPYFDASQVILMKAADVGSFSETEY